MIILCLLSDDRCDATADDLIDVVEGNRTYVPCIYLLNKIDQISIEELGKPDFTIYTGVSHLWCEHFCRLLYSSPRHRERWKERKETFN